VLDFQGAGVAGGDELAVQFSQLIFHGEAPVDPVPGAALPGAGNGLTDLVYSMRRGSTWLFADENDDGLLDEGDFAVQFLGRHAFTQDDFSATNFVIAGTEGDDTILGTEGDDVIFGLGGNDHLSGLAGNDELDGGAGDDVLEGGPGFDTLRGGEGNDSLSLKDGEFGGNASGGAGDDLLAGSDAAFSFSFLEGNEGNDALRAGAEGNTILDGGDGDDQLSGGAGDDQFTGGLGIDLFVFGDMWTSAHGFQDTIWDLEDGVEKIDLRASGLRFADLSIDDGGFSAVITAAAGRIEVSGFGEQGLGGRLTEDDFLFA
jgi:Ca2+-binding RTX toxin-like protein